MIDMVDEYETEAHVCLWRSGYNHGCRESERMIRDLQNALREEKELRKADNERFTNLLYPEDLIATDHEQARYVIAMRLLQSDIALDD